MGTAWAPQRSAKRRKPRNRRENGAPERIRTSDPCLRRAVLYPAELRARGFKYSTRSRGRHQPRASGFVDDAEQQRHQQRRRRPTAAAGRRPIDPEVRRAAVVRAVAFRFGGSGRYRVALRPFGQSGHPHIERRRRIRRKACGRAGRNTVRNRAAPGRPARGVDAQPGRRAYPDGDVRRRDRGTILQLRAQTGLLRDRNRRRRARRGNQIDGRIHDDGNTRLIVRGSVVDGRAGPHGDVARADRPGGHGQFHHSARPGRQGTDRAVEGRGTARAATDGNVRAIERETRRQSRRDRYAVRCLRSRARDLKAHAGAIAKQHAARRRGRHGNVGAVQRADTGGARYIVLHLPDAAARKCIAAVQLRRHQEGPRHILARTVGGPVVRRAEIVAKLVRRNQAIGRDAERALRQAGAETAPAKRAVKGNAHGRTVETAAGEQVRQTVGALRRVVGAIGRQLIEKTAAVRLIRKRVVRRREDIDPADVYLHAKLRAEDAVDVVHAGNQGCSGIAAFGAREFGIRNDGNVQLRARAPCPLDTRVDFGRHKLEQLIAGAHRARRLTVQRAGLDVEVGQTKHFRLSVSAGFEREDLAAIEHQTLRYAIGDHDAGPGLRHAGQRTAKDIEVRPERPTLGDGDQRRIRLQIDFETPAERVETHALFAPGIRLLEISAAVREAEIFERLAVADAGIGGGRTRQSAEHGGERHKPSPAFDHTYTRREIFRTAS